MEVLCERARRLELDREFDVVVSETIGSEGFEEGIVRIMERARERFLKPGGTLVPEEIALRAAPIPAIDAGRLSPPFLSDTSVTSLSRHVPRAVPAGPFRTLAPSRVLLRVDLRSATSAAPLPLGTARFRVPDGRKVGGLAVWVDVGLAPGVRLQTRSSPSWASLFLPTEPLPRGPGRLDLELDWNPETRRWRVEFRGHGGARHEAEHSPLFAWGAIQPALPRAGRR